MTLQDILKEACRNAFMMNTFSILGKNIDNLTKQATFIIKDNKTSEVVLQETKNIIENNYYFSNLSEIDRKKILEQHLLEARQPQAFIEEYPIHPNKKNQYIFKVLTLKDRKIICGTSSYFINENNSVLSLLSVKEIIKISMAYYRECFEEKELKNEKKNIVSKRQHLK